MTIGPFTTGTQPTSPLRLQVTDADGTPKDLSVYDTVTIEGLPDGTLTITDELHGRIEYDFDDPFETAGTVSFRVKMEQNDGDTDYSPWGEIEVEDAITPRATPAQAYGHTAQQVSAADLQLAQAQIALVVDRDLVDQSVWDGFSARDQGLLTQAISWQAVEMAKSEALGLGVLPGQVASMSTAGQSVSFAAGTTIASMTALSPITITVLNRLSWRIRQWSSYLEAQARGPAPDPWMREVDYVVGHNFGLYVGTMSW